LDLTYASSTITSQEPTECELDLLFEAMYNDYIGGHSSAAPRTTPATLTHQVLLIPNASTTVEESASTPINLSHNIYVAGSKNRPPMLNKDNYVPWSSRLHCYAKSKPNEKLIYNSIMHGPYVRRMIPEPGDLDREVPVAKTFNEQTDEELTKKEVKKIEADDQAIQTILVGLLEDIYAVVDSCETAQKSWKADHRPILLKQEAMDYGPRVLRFFNSWLDEKDFEHAVVSSWNGDDQMETKNRKINEKQMLLDEIKQVDDLLDQGLATDEERLKRSQARFIEIVCALGHDMQGCQELLEKLINGMGEINGDLGDTTFQDRYVDAETVMGFKVTIMNVYAPQDIGQKRLLWTYISDYMSSNDGNYILLGDYNLKKKKKRAMVLKIDFEKAYDSLSWEFLDRMMEFMHFLIQWRKWIQASAGITTSSKGVLEKIRALFFWGGYKGKMMVLMGGFDQQENRGSGAQPWARIIKLHSSLVAKGIDISGRLSKRVGCTIAERWNNGFWDWKWRRNVRGGIEQCQFTDLMVRLSEFRVRMCRIDSGGILTRKATRWNALVPRKVNILFWRVTLDRIPTRSNLSMRGINIPDIICAICGNEIEDIYHVFSSCEVAVCTWRAIFRWLQLSTVSMGTINDTMQWIDSCGMS
nr:RNA-directed DNA polymerase, eukaryota [Tanacetum cinerariifolium]